LNEPNNINAALATASASGAQGNQPPGDALPVRAFAWVGRLFLMLMLLMLFLSSSVQAQPILDRMEFVGQWGFGSYNSVASRGDVTIYSCGASLRIFDTTNPREMYEIARVQIRQYPTNIVIRGDEVFVSTMYELVIVDITDPHAPRVVSRNPWIGGGSPIALDETYLFVSSRDSVLRVFDIANLEQVTLLDSTRLDGFYSRDIGISCGLIFIARPINQPAIITYSWDREHSFIKVAEYPIWIDYEFELGDGFGITDAATLFIFTEDTLYATVNIVNEYDIGGSPPIIQGTLLFTVGLSDGMHHFHVINASDPFHTWQMGHFQSEQSFTIKAYSSGYFYSTGDKRSLVSIENLRRPEFIEGIEDAGKIRCMRIYRDALYFKAGKTVLSLNIDDNRTPFVLDSLFLESGEYNGADDLITAEENALYVRSENYIISIDISNPEDVFPIDSIHGDFRYGQADILIENGLGLITDYDCLYSFDFTEPGYFVPLDTLVLRAPLAIGKVNDEYAYVSDDYSGYFYIIDIHDPVNMEVIDRVRLGSDAYDFYIDGDLAYVAAYSGIAILDISDPVSPRIIGTYIPDVTPRAIKSIEKSGSLLYAEGSRGQIFVFSLEDPRSVELIGMVAAGGSSTGIAIHNEFVYRSDTRDGIKIYRHEMFNRVEYSGGAEQISQYNISCFPNPLNGVGTVCLSVPWAKQGTVALYSLNGREIATFSNSPLTASTQNMAVDFSRFASGSYFIKYQSDDFTIQSKIVIIR